MNVENTKSMIRKILIIDDEVEITKSLYRQFKRRYSVFTATNTAEAIAILKTEDIHVIVSDQRMPDMTGVAFFAQIKNDFPDTIKLILTGYSDIEAVIAAINKAQVFRYVTKPWNPEELDWTINEAFEKYELQATNRDLVANLKHANAGLEKKVKDRTLQLEEQYKLLKESEERYKALHNASFGGIVIHDKGLILECNQGLSEMTGYTYSELIGMDGLLLIAPETRGMVAANILAGYEKSYEAIGIRKNAETYPIRLEARNVPFKGKVVRTVEFRDITESRKAEEELKKSEEKFRNFFENSVVGMSITTIDGKLNVNNSFSKIVGYSEAELNNVNWTEITHADDIELNFRRVNSLLKGERKSDRWEKRYIRKNGEVVWTDISTTLQRDEQANPLYFITAIVDITERKEAEEALLKKNQELDYLNKFMVNREVRMAEIKKEINELLVSIGKEKRYP
jgi:PAS domain S-box-containing protein